jgi:hypothetical protein
MIEALTYTSNHVLYHQSWHVMKWEPVDARTESLLDGTDGPFNLSNMAISRNNIHAGTLHQMGVQFYGRVLKQRQQPLSLGEKNNAFD